MVCITGILILKKRYTTTKYLSVLMISIGICVCTIASANEMVNLLKPSLNIAQQLPSRCVT